MPDVKKAIDSPSAFKKRLVSTVTVLNLLIFTIVGLSLYQSRINKEDKVAVTSQSLTNILIHDVERDFSSIDMALLAVKHEAENQIVHGGGIDKNSLDRYISITHSYLPVLQGIRMTDAKGDILYGTGLTPDVIKNIVDRDYFIYQRDNPKGDIFISKPLLSRISNLWSIIIARRVNNPDGSFAGTVYGSLALDYFTKIFSQIDVGKKGSIILRNNELALIAGHPEITNTIGNKSVSKKFSDLFKAGHKKASFKARSVIDNEVSLISYQKSSKYPLVIAVGLAVDEYLAGWKEEILIQLVLTAFFTIVTIISSRMLLARWRHEKEVESDLREARDDLELRVAERTRELNLANEKLNQELAERRQVEEELLRAKQAAEIANAAKSAFLATMSHEIRTPMNGVIGMIELLQHTRLTSEQNEFAEEAKKSGCELVHLLNDILDLSKIEADKMELEISHFNLQPVITDTINLLSLSAHEKALKLVSSIDSNVPMALNGDPVRLRQAITNLVSNAVKFTTKGSVTLQVQKEAEEENSVTLRFLVKDTGIGIAANKLKQIFHPFTQADSSITRTYGGTGLGLTICRRLAEMMGGSIGVESTEGEGSTFWFTALLEKQIKVGMNKNKAPVSAAQLTLHLPCESIDNEIRILLAEDDLRAQKIVPRLLKSYGYQVDVACNGKEALLALQNNNYKLVLMDCMMPEMSGYEVTAIVRDSASSVLNHDIPIIALTGNAMKQDRDMCKAAGMNDHLPKPLILDDLLVKLDNWLKTTKA